MYNTQEIRKLTHVPQSLINIIFSELAVYATWFFGNFTYFITPNMVSLISLGFYIYGAWLFFKGSFIWGVAFIVLRNILDEVDGRLARLTNRTSKIGHLFDAIPNYIGTIAVFVAFFFNKNELFLKMLLPFFILMYFLYPLQNLTIRLLLNKTRKRKYQSLLCYQDARIVAFVILPLVYVGLPANFYINEVLSLFMITIVIGASQFFWMIYFLKDFKEKFNPDKTVKTLQ